MAASPEDLIGGFAGLLHSKGRTLRTGAVNLGLMPPRVRACIVAARLCDVESEADAGGDSDATFPEPFALADVSPAWLLYHLCTEGTASVGVNFGVGDDTGGGDDPGAAAAYTQLALPSAETEGLWESLVLDRCIKSALLSYSTSTLLFADARVDSLLVQWNHVILLHGPPGTGKTSLCKALAHKLSVRISDRYPSAVLIEINAHSLFSRWFSESGKLVSRLFAHITDLVDTGDCFVFLLIDEVESLTSARSAAVKGSEPSDAVRVVNAVLTAVDTLRARPNVLLLATSNVSEAIDVAFIDRADVRLYIGPPAAAARFAILASSFDELCRAGIAQAPLPPPAASVAGAAVKGTAPPISASAPTSASGNAASAAISLCEQVATLLLHAAAASASAAAASGGGEDLEMASAAGAMPNAAAAASAAGASTASASAASAFLQPVGRAWVHEAVAAFSWLQQRQQQASTETAASTECATVSSSPFAAAATAPAAAAAAAAVAADVVVVESRVVPGTAFSLAAPPLPDAAGAHLWLTHADVAALLLAAAASLAAGFSGRALRKLPLQAHARYVRRLHPAPPLLVAYAFVRAVVWEAGQRDAGVAK